MGATSCWRLERPGPVPVWPRAARGHSGGCSRSSVSSFRDRAQPGRVFTLTVAHGPQDCFGRILRATATDTVIACSGEKSEIYPNQKFVYDIRAKRLVSRVEYTPYSDFTIRRTGANRAAGHRKQRHTAGDHRLCREYVRVPNRRSEPAANGQSVQDDVGSVLSLVESAVRPGTCVQAGRDRRRQR